MSQKDVHISRGHVKLHGLLGPHELQISDALAHNCTP